MRSRYVWQILEAMAEEADSSDGFLLLTSGECLSQCRKSVGAWKGTAARFCDGTARSRATQRDQADEVVSGSEAELATLVRSSDP